jgi:4-hydroxybutyrate CoA-transferase
MDWRQRCGDKLVSADEAAALVKSGDRIVVGMFQGTPYTLCEAVGARGGELKDVLVSHSVSVYPWGPRTGGAFKVESAFLTAIDRPWMDAGKLRYVPVGWFRRGDLPPGFEPFDLFLTKVSPPDEHGNCSFGPAVWFHKTYAAHSKAVIAEVDESLIRTGGDNFIHLSKIERLVEMKIPPPPLPIPPRTQEEIEITEVIATLVATELVRDGDTLQMGAGTVSAAVAPYLEHRNDLGIHTEIITGGVPRLVEAGVITGKRKAINQGKVVGCAFAFIEDEELEIVDGNPTFELYDFTYTDDLQVLLQLDNFTSINNALMIDLTGQVTAETIGPRMYSGAGGQTVFAIASSYARDGRCITVMPSTSTVKGEKKSRVVPTLEAGTAITVPRTFVDYVVTEHGIATLGGKSLKGRAQEMIAVADPNFRSELQREARRLGLDSE